MSRKKEILGIDFDDVVFDCNASIDAFHNERYGTAHTREDHTTYLFEDIWNVSSEEVRKRMGEWYNTGYHAGTPVVRGAKEALLTLKGRYEIVIVTARSEETRELTESWIQKNLPGIADRTYFTGRGPLSPRGTAGGRKKSDVANELGIRYFVEDALHQVEDLVKNAPGTTVFLLDAPWNRIGAPENVTRAGSWDEIASALLHR